MSITAGKVETISDDGRFQKIVWCKRLGKRDRKPYLFFVRNGKAYPFKGVDIDPLCTVLDEYHVPAGMWSITNYTLLVSNDCKIYNGLQSWDGALIYTGEYENWQDIANYYQCDAESIKEVFEFFSPLEAERITRAENSMKEFSTHCRRKMSKFTQGPWKTAAPHEYIVYEDNTKEKLIITREVDGYTEEEQLANARLIAVAPEMYEIITHLIDGITMAELLNGSAQIIKVNPQLIANAKQLLARIDGKESKNED